jgi:hypothetical protein
LHAALITSSATSVVTQPLKNTSHCPLTGSVVTPSCNGSVVTPSCNGESPPCVFGKGPARFSSSNVSFAAADNDGGDDDDGDDSDNDDDGDGDGGGDDDPPACSTLSAAWARCCF